MGQSFSAEPVVEKHTETDRNETFDAAVSSCQGWRFSQEDDHSLILNLPGEHKASFFAVFDGHGSAKVSKHASENLWRHLTQNEMYLKGDFKTALEESFMAFDREVHDSYNAQLAGTTAVCVLIVDGVVYCANIGDSRAVAAVNCQCVPLSYDHKPENSVEMKRILSAGGYVMGNRVNGNLALSRAFGDFHYKSNEQLPPDQQIVSPFPEIKRIELNEDLDFIVIACDGIWDVLTSEEVINFVIPRLEQEVRPDQICEQLTTRCLATEYELVIGCDNMTVLLVCYTRGRSWSDYCTDIFNKNTKRLGLQDRARIFDNNFGNEQNDRHTTTSSDLSRDSSSGMNNTFINYDTSSTDTDTSSFSSGPSGRELFDSLVRAMGAPMSAMNDPDETPPISEVPAEETVETISEAGDDSKLADETVVDSHKTTTDKEGDDDKQADTISTVVTEVHLSSPDDDDDDGSRKMADKVDSEGDKDDQAAIEKSQEGEVKLVAQEDEKSEGIVEIQLSAPEEDVGPVYNVDEPNKDLDDEGEEAEVEVPTDELAAVTSGSPTTEETPNDDSGGGGDGGGGGEPSVEEVSEAVESSADALESGNADSENS